jgi:uncharacterized protein (DUF362 family)
MKTHHWTCITIALKNLMGLNVISTMHRMPRERMHEHMERPDYKELRECGLRDVPHFDLRFFNKATGDPSVYNRENDVLWRTLADLNRIILYADADGVIQTVPQRRCLNIVDGIIGTDGEGPITRTRVNSGTIVAGVDPVRVDAACCRVMGLEPQTIRLVYASAEHSIDMPIGVLEGYEQAIVCSRKPGRMPAVRRYAPPSSWMPTEDHDVIYRG